MTTAPYILGGSFAESHRFAQETLGLGRGLYRIVTSAASLKAVRGVDLYLVPGWEKRYDRFQIRSALRWTRMNVIDAADLEPRAEEPAAPEPEPDGLQPAGTQPSLWDTLLEGVEERNPRDAAGVLTPEDIQALNDIEPEPDPEPQAEEPAAEAEPAKKPGRRRSRCKTCGALHYKEDPCPTTPEEA